MLNYGDTPQPVGIMNDKVGIMKHERPSMNSLNNWKNLINEVQTKHFAQEYLNTLGKNTLEQLGYSYEDIKQAIGEADINLCDFRKIFPWTIAIQPKENWTFMERYIADRYFAIKNKGFIRGTLSNFKKHFIKSLKLLKNQLKIRKYYKDNNIQQIVD